MNLTSYDFCFWYSLVPIVIIYANKLSFVQRIKFFQKKTDTEPWMILEKASRNLDTTRQTFSSQRPRNDRVANKNLDTTTKLVNLDVKVSNPSVNLIVIESLCSQ